MAAPTLAVIEAVDSAKADISPISAFVHLTLTGDKFFSGNAAFSKAEELRKLAEALESRGIPKAALSLVGASVDVSSGVFSKSSSVTYRVRITIEDLELLGSVLDIVSDAKKASLTRLEWNYDDHGEEERELLRIAGQRATAKARALAESIGEKLGPLHSAREERIAEKLREESYSAVRMAAPAMRERSSVADELGGLELAPKRQVMVRVAVAYLVAPPAVAGS
jgi:uncharacterized protein YggE